LRTADYSDIRERTLRHITAESHVRLENFMQEVNSIKAEIKENREETRMTMKEHDTMIKVRLNEITDEIAKIRKRTEPRRSEDERD
jgi:hypothetical protein